MHPIQHWYPARLRNDKHGLHCEWIELKDIPFADPFFDETLTRGRGKPLNSGCFRPTSSIAVLAEWSNALPHVQPTAFVFHVSRCGSTLLSQLLGLHPRSISLAEVPFFDDVLRLPFKASVPSGVDLNRALAAAIAIYGQHRTGDEKHLFIKLDSWHVFFWRQIRACYPDVPFFLLYRRPDEVLQSHRKLRGMHAVPGLIEPAILGFRPDEVDPADLDGYLERVLDRYFSMYLQIAFTDSTALLLNYADGPLPLLHTIATRCGVRLSNTYLEAATKRAGFDAKHPRQPFAERREPPHAAPLLPQAFVRYEQLECLRLSGSI